jgi:hypothetical protein
MKRGSGVVTGKTRLLLGFLFGLAIMYVVTRVFAVTSFDHGIMQRGMQEMLAGVSPWAPETRLLAFFNPPFFVLFLWPMLLLSPKGMLILGGATLFALVLYRRSWAAVAWFGTHTFLWIVAAGGVDMYLMGVGLVLLVWSDKCSRVPLRVLLRVVAYGFLMTKPQGGVFVVIIYVLMRRDWQGVALSLVVYGGLFLPLYPDWIDVIWATPPTAQIAAPHSLGARFSPLLTIPVAIWVTFSRRWTYWQLGGALAAILSPYGMPGIPIFLVLTAVDRPAAVPAVLVYSGCLAVFTWVAPQSPLMGIYHLGMLGLALILACLLPDAAPDDPDSVDARKLGRIVIQAARTRLVRGS